VDNITTLKLAEELVQLLSIKNWHITFAESCTGGKVAAGIVGVANVSAVFEASVVTYANEAKIKYLGVKPETIEELGVVSEEVAIQMATGIAIANNAEVGVGITGIAGPTGGSDKKPVGTVCFGFYINGECFSETMYFGNIGRNKVRDSSVEFVYNRLIEYLNKI
jgi:nicotinamide-nucleotide amidase